MLGGTVYGDQMAERLDMIDHLRSRLTTRSLAITATALVVSGGAWALASAAQAGGLVFVKPSGDVWLARPDGTHQHRVTRDGTVADPYYSPTQSSSGTIEVARGQGTHGRIYRLRRNGTRQNAPFRVPVPAVTEPVISPDGRKVAFWTLTSAAPCATNFYCFEVSDAGRYSLLSTPAWMTFESPTWLGNSRLLLFNSSGTLSYTDLGQSGYKTWLSWLDYFSAGTSGFGEWITGVASPDGTKLALVTHIDNQSRFVIQLFSGPTNVHTGDLTSYKPILSPCVVAAPGGRNGADVKHPDLPAFHSLSFSPDGSSLAYEDASSTYVTTLGSLTDCTRITTRKVIARGTDPFWGPANVP